MTERGSDKDPADGLANLAKSFPGLYEAALLKVQKENRRKRLVALSVLAAVLLGVGVAAWGLFLWTTAMGRSNIAELAKENGICSTEDCSVGITLFHSFAKSEFGFDGPLLEWCLGTDKWNEAHVRRGGIFKTAAVFVMYLPCGKLNPFTPEGATPPDGGPST